MSSSEAKFIIVMANYNGYDFTKVAVESLLTVEYANKIIVVVDDCSTDDSYSKLQKLDNIILLKTEKNSGLDAAFNVGIRYALDNVAEYVFLVQNDTDRFSKNILNSAIECFESDPKIGLVGPSVTDKFEQSRWSEKGKKLFDTAINTSEGFVIKREVFEKIGLFNEGLVVYFEDLDFIIRMRKKGYITVHDSKSSFLHIGQATFSKQRFKPDFLRIRNIFMMQRRYTLCKGVFWNLKEAVRLIRRHFEKFFYFLSKGRIINALIEISAIILGVVVGLVKPWDESNEKN